VGVFLSTILTLLVILISYAKCMHTLGDCSPSGCLRIGDILYPLNYFPIILFFREHILSLVVCIIVGHVPRSFTSEHLWVRFGTPFTMKEVLT